MLAVRETGQQAVQVEEGEAGHLGGIFGARLTCSGHCIVFFPQIMVLTPAPVLTRYSLAEQTRKEKARQQQVASWVMHAGWARRTRPERLELLACRVVDMAKTCKEGARLGRVEPVRGGAALPAWQCGGHSGCGTQGWAGDACAAPVAGHG